MKILAIIRLLPLHSTIRRPYKTDVVGFCCGGTFIFHNLIMPVTFSIQDKCSDVIVSVPTKAMMEL